MRFAAKSEKGKRIQNEDYVYIPAGRDDIPLAVVADGMGGHRAGSIASTLAVETLLEEFRGSGERWPESRIVPALCVEQTKPSMKCPKNGWIAGVWEQPWSWLW